MTGPSWDELTGSLVTDLDAVIARAREAWEAAGRPGDKQQLRLADGAGRVFGCVVCEDRGCEHCPQVRA